MGTKIHFATFIISLDPPDTLGRTAPFSGEGGEGGEGADSGVQNH